MQIALKKATSCKLTFLLTSDGGSSPWNVVLSNATLQGDCVSGPLLNALNNTYADAAAIKDVFGAGSVRLWLRPESGLFPASVQAQTDVTTPTKPAVKVIGGATEPLSGTTAYLDVEFVHSIVK